MSSAKFQIIDREPAAFMTIQKIKTSQIVRPESDNMFRSGSDLEPMQQEHNLLEKGFSKGPQAEAFF